MNGKNILIILVLIAVGTIIFAGTGGLKKISSASGGGISLSDFVPGSLSLPFFNSSPDNSEAWSTFQKYMGFAKAHDLDGLKSLSHQISPACNDPARESECFELMDSVYNFSTFFIQEDFKNVVSDSKQTILYTEGPDRAFLYFTRGEDNELRVLSMRFCQDDPENGFDCVASNASTADSDQNGWWDSTESLFYK